MNGSEVGQLLIGGVPVALFVFLVVEALKWSGMLKTGDAIRVAVLVLATIGAAIWAATSLYPQLQGVATILFTAVIGAAVATLAYQGQAKLRSKQ